MVTDPAICQRCEKDPIGSGSAGKMGICRGCNELLWMGTTYGYSQKAQAFERSQEARLAAWETDNSDIMNRVTAVLRRVVFDAEHECADTGLKNHIEDGTLAEIRAILEKVQ